MKILKVIVDEVPKRCYDCVFVTYDACSDGYVCLATSANDYGKSVTDIHTKPSWCPLVKGICARCYGTGTILTPHKSHPDPCPDCGGHKVATNNRKTIQYESED